MTLLKMHTPNCWRQIQKNNFTNWNKLAEFLELTPSQRAVIGGNKTFPLNLPVRLASKVTKKTLEDPILKQFLPLVDETSNTEGFVADPVGDAQARCADQLIHKYQGRVLLVCTSACAMHCRYCFRQNFDYRCQDKGFQKEIEQIRGDSSIKEVILSGGDPLSLSDQVLKTLVGEIQKILHIKRIRFHTRFPIGIPERITEDFLEFLGPKPEMFWFVVHVNHPNELDSDVLQAFNRLRRQGVQVLNQSVLLKGVNDDPDTLVELCEALVDNGVVPYYLHQLDRVKGTAHFEVPISRGKQLIEEISKRLSGYAVPRYVQEIAGMSGKTPI